MLESHRHVVAQVVEPELVVRPVRDVGARTRAGARSGLIARLDQPDLEAEEPIDPAHPLGVALGQVVVDGHEVDALALRARSGTPGRVDDERLALARPHLGDVALVQRRAAHQLDVEVALADRPPRAPRATAANASGSRSSSGSPFSIRSRNSTVLCARTSCRRAPRSRARTCCTSCASCSSSLRLRPSPMLLNLVEDHVVRPFRELGVPCRSGSFDSTGASPREAPGARSHQDRSSASASVERAERSTKPWRSPRSRPAPRSPTRRRRRAPSGAWAAARSAAPIA